ncbi:CoA-binding protein [Ferruginibacter yonginensis]|uniref:CoA-binding protein n=1 Tax=Ferruginibacter yonginensis TaxID=1310416 RepID=A0ABV8QUS7_9BACT
MKKKTMVLGASTNTERYSNMAVKKLQLHQHPVVAIGNKIGTINDTPIIKETPDINDVDTVTLYLNPTNQQPYYDYILSLHPKRIIFNPGTENKTLEKIATEKGIQTIEACTLVLLATNQF